MRPFALSTAAALACTLTIPVASAQDPRYGYRNEGPASPNYRHNETRPRSYTIPDPVESRYYYRLRRPPQGRVVEEAPYVATLPSPLPDPDTAARPPAGEPTLLAAAPTLIPAAAFPTPTRTASPKAAASSPSRAIAKAPAPAAKGAAAAPKAAATMASRAPKVASLPPPRTDRVTLATKDLFEIDQATLRGHRKKLDELAAMIRADGAGEVRISSYTDKLGPESFNLRLSQRRAEAIRDYLVLKGVPASRLKAVGRGEDDPLVYCEGDGADWQWHALNRCLEPNRRIEVERVIFEREDSRRS